MRGSLRLRGAQYRGDLEDVVQETLLAIHVKRHTWRVDAPLIPWINAIARNKLVDVLRRRNRRGDHVTIGIDDVARILTQPETDATSDGEIGRALGALTPVQRAVVTAVSVDGRSIGETAKNLG